MAKRMTIFGKCMGCGDIIPALDIYCIRCETERLVQPRVGRIAFIKPGQSLGNRRC